jgi:hypothetical protein
VSSSPTRTRTSNKPVNSRKSADRNPLQGNTSSNHASQLSAPLAQPGPADAELARILDAWPTLPAHIRAAVLALVDTARNREEGNVPGAGTELDRTSE